MKIALAASSVTRPQSPGGVRPAGTRAGVRDAPTDLDRLYAAGCSARQGEPVGRETARRRGEKTTQRAAPMRSGPRNGNQGTVRLVGLPERLPGYSPGRAQPSRGGELPPGGGVAYLISGV